MGYVAACCVRLRSGYNTIILVIKKARIISIQYLAKPLAGEIERQHAFKSIPGVDRARKGYHQTLAGRVGIDMSPGNFVQRIILWGGNGKKR